MITWWETCRPGDPKTVVLIQFDLMGHSPWAEAARARHEVAKERTGFALMLRHRLAYLGFHCLYWLGDGGVFARLRERQEDTDAATKAADEAFNCFHQFQGTTAGTESLSFRATATLIEVILHPEPGQWFSPELNEFLKYERKLALRDAFVITDPLYRDLSDEVARRFSSKRSVRLQNREVSAYTDTDHPFKLPESPDTFAAWLQRRTDLAPSRNQSSLLQGLRIVGDAAIVNTAPTRAGYEAVSLIQTVFPQSEFGHLVAPFREEWEAAMEVSSRFAGVKTAPLRLTCPVTDDPTVYLDHSPINYGVIHAFHQLVEKNAAFQNHFLPEAMRYQESSGRRMPGAVAVDVAVILKGNELLFAHRVPRKGGYNPELWSVSLEEHFAIAKSTYGGREHPADGDIEATIVRGLREEFVSLSFAGEMVVSVQAVSLDLVNLNLQFLAIVQLPDTSFKELAELWRLPNETPDGGEHDCLATAELDPEILAKTLRAESPGELIKQSAGANYADRATHGWHPRSKSRLACCLWLSEKGVSH
jgi:hypothetical protein